jgi:hypothetical protein
MIVILAGVVFWGFFASNIVAETFEKRTSSQIPQDQKVPSLASTVVGGKGFCEIKSDSGVPDSYFGSWQAGDGLALYMDPTKCGLPDPYPFKVTDVHFYLCDFGCTWPVEIQINIRDLSEGDKCNGPGDILCSQTYSIPQDSAYPIFIHLDLASLCCVYAPFFLEIVNTGQTSSPYPSLVMSDSSLDYPDTCDAWTRYFWEDQHYYFEWSNFWASPPPGCPIMRITGYTQQCHPESCWYWKADHPNQEFPAPSGMPDFGQYQFVTDSVALCGPTAVANCLWWYNAVPTGVSPDSLIRLLSTYFHTDPDSGTYVDSILSGLNRYFGNYGFSLYAHLFTQPEFYAMEDSLKKSQDIILLLGFWQLFPIKGAPPWIRFGGHYVTMAGVCSDSQKIALSDPARDMAEAGLPGRVRPPEHPSHTDGDTLHNHPQYVSHDIYQANLQPYSPGGLWWLPDYYLLDKVLAQFQGQNFQPDQWPYYNPYIPMADVYTEVEYAIMICPSNWYWKPDRPDQGHPAPSGMPDFDQNQDEWVSYCGPTAVANCLWWFDAVPERWTPPQLIDTLAARMHCRPEWGTYVDTMQMALDQYFQDYKFALQESTFHMPNFFEMEDSLKKCQDIILLLGFWWYDGQEWQREGGHFVTMAGVCSESLKIALSDPDRDRAVAGWPGRVRPPGHPGPGDYSATLHNDPSYVSQDMYNSMLQSPSPGNPDWGIDYIVPRGKYSGINVPKEFISVTRSAPKDDVTVYYTEVEYAVMICPKPTAVEEEEEEGGITPKDFELYQSYPNPFNNQTIIKYDLLKSCQVSLTIYNILGQKVKTLVEGYQVTGSKVVNWDGKDEKGKDLASGIYFYQLKAGEATQTKRMTLLK